MKRLHEDRQESESMSKDALSQWDAWSYWDEPDDMGLKPVPVYAVLFTGLAMVACIGAVLYVLLTRVAV